MQISTRQVDYIIDPFPLWNDMYILNEPFTNPNILKVINSNIRKFKFFIIIPEIRSGNKFSFTMLL